MHRWYGKIAVVQRWERQTHLKIISKPRGKSMSMSGLVKPTCWVSCRSSASFPQPVAIIYLDVPKRSKQTYTNTLLVVSHPCLGRSPTNRFRGLKHVETIFLGQDQSRLAQSLSKKHIGAEFWLTCKKQKENKSNYPYRTNELTASQVIVHDCLHGCVFIWYWGTGSNHLEIKYVMLIEPLKGKCQCLCAAWDPCRRLLPRPSREVDDFDQRRRREEHGNWAPTASGHGSESPESSWGCHGECNHR